MSCWCVNSFDFALEKLHCCRDPREVPLFCSIFCRFHEKCSAPRVFFLVKILIKKYLFNTVLSADLANTFNPPWINIHVVSCNIFIYKSHFTENNPHKRVLAHVQVFYWSYRDIAGFHIDSASWAWNVCDDRPPPLKFVWRLTPGVSLTILPTWFHLNPSMDKWLHTQ